MPVAIDEITKRKVIGQWLTALPNPNQREQQESCTDDDSTRKINEIHDMVKSLLNLHKHDSSTFWSYVK